jgi:hypothetical protein
LKQIRQKDIYESSKYNNIALNELETEKIKEIHKKFIIQNLLQSEYDNQINLQKSLKTEERSYDKVFCKKHKEVLDNYEKSRIKELGQIYNFGNKPKKERVFPFLRENLKT